VAIKPGHRDLALLNGRPPVATRDLVAVLQTTLFSPDDLELVKGGPAGRRELLDDANAASLPQAAQERSSFDRILRQRNTLLHQLSGRLSEDERLTLDIWDDRLAEAGERLAERREKLVAALLPFVTDAWSSLVPDADPLSMAYQRSFAGNLRQALVSRRNEDLRRQVTTVGPQRDDLLVFSGDLDARTRLSQGRQRCVALSLRLAVHRYLTDVTGFAPVLLLDDAFSELDQRTSYLLVRELPRSQAIVTTAGEPPSGFPNALIVNLEDGVLR
jgi:DNA replication and repair protein RecF